MTARRARRPQLPVAQRRAELAGAALQVMRREGAWALTTRAVAAEADVPHGSVHYAFASKEALLEAVIQEDAERGVAAIRAAGAAGGSTREVLARASRAYADSVRADPAAELVQQELTLMAARDERLRPLAQQSTSGYRAGVIGLLDDLAARCGGSWDAPSGVIADQMLALLFGAGIDWLVTRDDARFDAALDDAARMFAARLRPGG